MLSHLSAWPRGQGQRAALGDNHIESRDASGFDGTQKSPSAKGRAQISWCHPNWIG